MKCVKMVTFLCLLFISHAPAMNRASNAQMDAAYKTALQKSLKSFEAYVAELSTLEQKDNATLEAMATSNITLARLKLITSSDMRAAVTKEKNVSIFLVKRLKSELN